MSHQVSLEWKGKMHFESKGPGGSVLIDGVEEFGGEGKGVRPKAMMLSALAGCSGIDIVDILEKMKVVDYELKMEVEGFLTEEHPKFYDKVHVDYHFYGTDLNPKKIDKAVKLSVDKYCGVMEMFRQFSTVTTAIHIHNS